MLHMLGFSAPKNCATILPL
uniref:Uncharacterized protein n=1 Tax=Rhizophora mucronata TaxID=61149 RepID=A0A2P2N9D2_RHIMU